MAIMAIVNESQGKYDEVLEYYNKASEIKLIKLGNDHPDVADTKYDIAIILYKYICYNEREAKKLI